MAFPNYYGAPAYYGQPMPDHLAQLRQGQYPQYMQQPPQQIQQPANSGITWVQGESGAKAYMVAAGNTVMLMDSEGESFYLKSTASNGMPMPLRIFDYKERTVGNPAQASSSADYVTRDEFHALEERINEILEKQKSNMKEEDKNA